MIIDLFSIRRNLVANKIDKETEKHKEFYENFIQYTTYSTIIIIAIVALMAIFLV